MKKARQDEAGLIWVRAGEIGKQFLDKMSEKSNRSLEARDRKLPKQGCANPRTPVLFLPGSARPQSHAARPSTSTGSPVSAGAGLRLAIKRNNSIMSFRMRRNAK
jgi:hypothetical protein